MRNIVTSIFLALALAIPGIGWVGKAEASSVEISCLTQIDFDLNALSQADVLVLLATCQSVLKNDPANIDALLNTATIHDFNGDTQAAIRLLSSAPSNDPRIALQLGIYARFRFNDKIFNDKLGPSARHRSLFEEAYGYFRSAAIAGNAEASAEQYDLFMRSLDFVKEFMPESVEELAGESNRTLVAAAQNGGEAARDLFVKHIDADFGAIATLGLGPVFEALETLAEAAHVDSQTLLAEWQEKGRESLEPNSVKSAFWYRQAALRGDFRAEYNLGRLYAAGVDRQALLAPVFSDQPQDSAAIAADCYDVALWPRNIGTIDAPKRQGRPFDEITVSEEEASAGEGLEYVHVCLAAVREDPDDDKAAAAYARALVAASKHADALAVLREREVRRHPEVLGYLGVLYENGYGTEPDMGRAAGYYRLAAEAGLAPAQYNLGIGIIDGNIAADGTSGMEWLRRAAEQGYQDAYPLVAEAYHMGTDLPRDATQAQLWWDRTPGSLLRRRFGTRVATGERDRACELERSLATQYNINMKGSLLYCAMTADTLTQALAHFELITGSKKSEERLARQKGDIYLRFEQWPEADAAYHSALKLASASTDSDVRGDIPWILFGQYEVARRSGDSAAARDILAKAFAPDGSYTLQQRMNISRGVHKVCGRVISELWPLIASPSGPRNWKRTVAATRFFPPSFDVDRNRAQPENDPYAVSMAREFRECFLPEIDKGLSPPLPHMHAALTTAALNANRDGFLRQSQFLLALARELGGSMLTTQELARHQLIEAEAALDNAAPQQANSILERLALNGALELTAENRLAYGRALARTGHYGAARAVLDALLMEFGADEPPIATALAADVARTGLGATVRSFPTEYYLNRNGQPGLADARAQFDLLFLLALEGQTREYLKILGDFQKRNPAQSIAVLDSGTKALGPLLSKHDIDAAKRFLNEIQVTTHDVPSDLRVSSPSQNKFLIDQHYNILSNSNYCADGEERGLSTVCLGSFLELRADLAGPRLSTEAYHQAALHYFLSGGTIKVDEIELLNSMARRDAALFLERARGALLAWPGADAAEAAPLIGTERTGDYLNLPFLAAQRLNSGTIGNALAIGQNLARRKPELAMRISSLEVFDRRERQLRDRLLALLFQSSNGDNGGEANPESVMGTLIDDGARPETLQAEIARLRLAREAAVDEIVRIFPPFADLTNPAPLPIGRLQALLTADELVLFTFSGQRDTYVWGITKDGVELHRAPLSSFESEALVRRIRRSLGEADSTEIGAKIDAQTASPDAFDRAAAYALYDKLFGPFIMLMKTHPRIIAVVDGPLTSIPLSILVSATPAGEDSDPDSLRATRWWGHEYAVRSLPSIAALQLLRENNVLGADRKAPNNVGFVGFGDPSLAPAADGGAQPGPEVYLRGGVANVTELRKLASLPGTKIEIEAIAALFGGERAKIYLGEGNTEAALRQSEIAPSQVLAFATHGLVSGDVGLFEPALVFTPPEGDASEPGNDGLLTATEITGFDVDSDLVILSACNTAAGDAIGAPALSGLARSFFFAGARSLLVSHWRVPDEAAPLISRGVVQQARDHPEIGWAEALRRAMIALMNNPDNELFADPWAWGPFSIVGID